MAQQYEQITDRLAAFIAAQHMFFVGTAARDGRVNVSPKGQDSLRVLGPNRVVWLNGTGSGNETAAHLREVNRMTIMFCSFVREPLILRLYGTATEIQPDEPEYAELEALFPPMLGARQVYDVAVDLVQTSCGYGVPFMEYTGERPLMASWAEKKGPEGLARYHEEKNLRSIDGFETGLRVGSAVRDQVGGPNPPK
ncbi:MAG: pyridoxamine 5'-phosphate oxidase family protein [Promicromonosporaceae bacterium]|nr:pyridoxamine 5'-phosphate oxidase family protein [Promicromonosporaceae bacterium]